MRPSSILVVDCGASRVLAARCRRDAAGCLAPERSGAERLARRDRTEDGWLAETGTALARLARRESLAGVCVVGLPAHLTFTRVVNLPPATARQRRRIIEFEMRQGAPLPLAEVVWVQAAVRASGGGETVVLTAVRRSTIAALGAHLWAAGLYPRAVLPAWHVVSAGLAGDQGGSSRTLAVAIGARSTQFVYRGAAGWWLRTLALGGDTVTEKIAVDTGSDFACAESLKLELMAGSSAPESPGRRAAQSAADEFSRRLGGEISRSLVGLGAKGGDRPDRLSLSGGGALLAGLADRLAEDLRLPVARRAAEQRGEAVASRPGEPPPDAPALAGELADLAAGRRGRGVNLLPWQFRLATWAVRNRAVLAGAACAAAIAMAGAGWQARTATLTARLRAAEVGIAVGELRRLDERNRGNLRHLSDVRNRSAALQRLVAAKRGWLEFLADLQERLARTGDAWLDRLQMTPPAPPPRTGGAPGPGPAGPGAGCSGIRVRLAGCLFDPENPLGPAGPGVSGRARDLLAQFRASPFVAGVENEQFDGAQPGVLRFEVTLALAPGKLP